jgi:hypothetical protein
MRFRILMRLRACCQDVNRRHTRVCHVVTWHAQRRARRSELRHFTENKSLYRDSYPLCLCVLFKRHEFSDLLPGTLIVAGEIRPNQKWRLPTVSRRYDS